MNEKGINRNIELVALIAIAIIIVAVFSGGIFSGGNNDEPNIPSYEGTDYALFKSENYNFYFPYLKSWNIGNLGSSDMTTVSVSENITEGKPVAEVIIYAGDLSYPSLEEVSDRLENNENIRVTDEMEVSVDGADGTDVSFVAVGENRDTKARTRVLKKGDFEYSISYYVQENYFEQFKSGLVPAIENFHLM